jgi:hypothetical protein
MSFKIHFRICRSRDLKRVWCNARSSKKAFYEKFGMNDTFKTFVKADQEFKIMEIMLS